MDSLVARTQKALLQAVDQLVTDFKLYSLDFLPYEAHLVILTYIYANNANLTGLQLRRVRQWFWRTSFSERYRGAPDDFVTRDLKAVQKFVLEGDAEPGWLGSVPDSAAIESMIFRKNNSRSRAFVLALAKQHPGNITNGATIDTAVALSVYNKKQFHHIFPEAFLRRTQPNVERNYLLNFCMLAAAENNLVGDKDPQQYMPFAIEALGGKADRVFSSNLLPMPSEYDYASASLESFMKARVPIIERTVKDLCDGGH